jgi:transposase
MRASNGEPVAIPDVIPDVIEDRFGVVYAERSISRLLAELGFVHISARPQHPAQNPKVIDAYKKTSPERSQRI